VSVGSFLWPGSATGETSSENYRNPEKPFYTDYWMNFNLSVRKNENSNLILLGDGGGNGSNARYAMRGFPANWRSMGDEQAKYEIQPPWFQRHLGGANYAFADGHVKWLRPEDAAPVSRWKPQNQGVKSGDYSPFFSATRVWVQPVAARPCRLSRRAATF